MKPFSSPIVEKQSALLEVEHEEQIPVGADHCAMCKFATIEDDTFERVWKRIRRMRKEAPPQGANNQAVAVDSYNKHFEVPHLLSPIFTGQDEICQSLDLSLALSRRPRGQVQRRFVLFGLGGSGKTQICVRYAQVHRERYWGVFWIDASTSHSIRRSYIQIASLLQVDQDVDSVKHALANTSPPWLLIFDNADDPSLSLTRYFPPGDRGDVIATSRNPGCQQYGTVGAKEVGRMTPKDAFALLTKTVSGVTVEQDYSHMYEDNTGLQVVQILGCLALAIVQAGAYIRETSCSPKDYLELYRRRRNEVLTYIPKHVGTDYRYTVYTTWQVSLDRIGSIHDDASQHALTLLYLLCYYHHEQVPIQMFYEAWQNSRGTPKLEGLLWPGVGQDFWEYRRAVQAAIALLASFSLVTRDAETSLSMHPLVHEWCREKLAQDEGPARGQRAISMLATSILWRFQAEDYSFRRLLVSHARVSLQHGVNKDTELDEAMAEEWSRIALMLGENGSTREAIQLLELVVTLRKSKLGTEHLDTLTSMHSLAISYSEVGRREEALQLMEQVVALLKSKLGAEHPDTLMSMHSLANSYSEVGRREEALQLTEQVVALLKSKLGAEHPDTLMSMHSLANSYSEVGRREEALQLTEQVVALRKSKLGAEHPDTLMSMHSLAISYSEVGRREEALQLTEQVVALHKSKLGAEHPDTLRSMHSLAISYSEARRREEALQLMEQVVALRKSKLGAEHPDTLRSMHRLAIWYSEARRREEALQLMEQVVALRKSKLGVEHPDTLKSVKRLAYIEKKIGQDSQNLGTVRQSWHMLSKLRQRFQ